MGRETLPFDDIDESISWVGDSRRRGRLLAQNPNRPVQPRV